MTTLNDIQLEASAIYEESNTSPTSTTAEYQRRTRLINMFERKWARERSYRWSQLYTTTTLSFTANVGTVSLPSDFTQKGLTINPEGTIKIGNHYYQVISPDQIGGYDSTDDRYLVLYGNEQAGYTFKINPTPQEAISFTINYYTQNLATNNSGTGQEVLSASTDITKIPNPLYLTYGLVSMLYKTDDMEAKGQDFERLATNELISMLGDEDQGVNGQSNVIPATFEIYEPLGSSWRHH